MNPGVREQLVHLDRSLLALLDERARLVAAQGPEASGLEPPIADLLARSAGPFPAPSVERVFGVIAEGCRAAAESEAP